MKHIQESIIGKKGVTGIPKLKNHDIVKLDNDHYYMVVLDEYEMKLTKLDFFESQITGGILVKYEDATWSSTSGWYWQPINEYGSDLKIKPRFRTRTMMLDIIEVYRSLSAITTKYNDHLYMWCDEEKKKKKIMKRYGGYKLLWKR